MANPQLDELYDGGELPDEYPVYAADTFPAWGRALAWMTWRCPMFVYVAGIGGGVALGLLAHPGQGVALGLVSLTIAAYCLYARKSQPDPFRYAILMTDNPIPREDLDAAASGAPVPAGPEHRAQETQT
jgi:hypothetical protein